MLTQVDTQNTEYSHNIYYQELSQSDVSVDWFIKHLSLPSLSPSLPPSLSPSSFLSLITPQYQTWFGEASSQTALVGTSLSQEATSLQTTI